MILKTVMATENSAVHHICDPGPKKTVTGVYILQ